MKKIVVFISFYMMCAILPAWAESFEGKQWKLNLVSMDSEKNMRNISFLEQENKSCLLVQMYSNDNKEGISFFMPISRVELEEYSKKGMVLEWVVKNEAYVMTIVREAEKVKGNFGFKILDQGESSIFERANKNEIKWGEISGEIKIVSPKKERSEDDVQSQGWHFRPSVHSHARAKIANWERQDNMRTEAILKNIEKKLGEIDKRLSKLESANGDDNMYDELGECPVDEGDGSNPSDGNTGSDGDGGSNDGGSNGNGENTGDGDK